MSTHLVEERTSKHSVQSEVRHWGMPLLSGAKGAEKL